MTDTQTTARPVDPQLVNLKNVRLRYNDLWRAREFTPGDGKPRWSAVFLIEPGSANDRAIRTVIEQQAAITWNAKAPVMLKGMAGQSAKMCYLDGDNKADDSFHGHWVLSANRSVKTKRGPATPPTVVNSRAQPITEDSGLIYNGCVVNANVRIYCQSVENAGVRCSLEGVQFVAHGEEFAATGGGAAAFDDLGTDDEVDFA